MTSIALLAFDRVRRDLGAGPFRNFSALFASQLVLSASMFLVMMLASMRLEAADFAKLSLAMGWIGVAAAVMNFGLDQTALKFSLERNTIAFVVLNFQLKAGGLGLFTLLALVLALAGRPLEAIVIAAAGGVAFWTSTRIVEQYHQRYMRLAGLNLALAASRLVMGGLALLSYNWALVTLALHLVAQAPIHAFSLAGLLRGDRGEATVRDLGPMLQVAPLMYAAGALFVAAPVITQQALLARAHPADASAFGVVLMFIGPITLLVGTLRTTLLPNVLASQSQHTHYEGHPVGVMLAFAAVVIAILTITVGFIVPYLYDERLPAAAPFARIYLSAYAAAALFGVLNLRSQRGKLIRVDFLVNLARCLGTWVCCALLTDPVTIVSSSAAILAAGEVTLFVLIRTFDRRSASTRPRQRWS